jgi:hypothetical protein
MFQRHTDIGLVLGPCCRCRDQIYEGGMIIMLNVECQIRGHGWGCLVCGVPANGACVVLCTACGDLLSQGTVIRDYCLEACRGFPRVDGRCSIGELTTPFDHDYSRHPEVYTPASDVAR